MFKNPLIKIKEEFECWLRSEDGVAATEAALVFPLMLVLLLGTFDMGRGILSNQKLVRASQVTADLVTRGRSISQGGITEAVDAGRLALTPFTTDSYGVEIVSIGFDEDSVPSVEFREVRGTIAANNDVLTDVASLAEPNGGVVVVSVVYDFVPTFAGFVIDTIPMRETAFARGRKSAVVRME